MRVFLTGSLGYVGTVLEELLQKENFEVVGCDVGYFPKSLEDSKNENFLNNIYKENIIKDFSHAEDICNAIYLLIRKNVNLDNLILSSSKKTKINSIINYLLRKYNSSIKITSTPRKNKNFIIGDNKLAKNILNWKPSKSISLPLAQSIQISH